MDELKDLLATFKCVSENLKTMHFEVEGFDFMHIHKLCEKYKCKIDEMYDELTEYAITKGVAPVTIKDVAIICSDSILSATPVSCEDVITNITLMFNNLYAKIINVRTKINENEFDEFRDMAEFFYKEINYILNRMGGGLDD